MCTNRRKVVNLYNGQTLYVNCGVCPACMQEKANRYVTRIKNTTEEDEIVCFATLTYDNRCCPYIRKQVISKDKHLYYVFRNSHLVRDRRSSHVEVTGPQVIDEIQLIFTEYDLKKYRSLKGYPQSVGVCYLKDMQDFIKRFRQNLHYKTKYYDKRFKYFFVSEYGGKRQRPHYHCLLWCRKQDFQLFNDVFVKSWKFQNYSKIDRSRVFEIARDAAGYVASYVNCSSYVPECFRRSSAVRPRATFSRGFGVSSRPFSLHALKRSIIDGYNEYFVGQMRNGVPSVVAVPVPSYVGNRYFPKFKGLSRLSYSAIYDIVRKPSRISIYARTIQAKYERGFVNDLHVIKTRLENAYKRYCSILSLPIGSDSRDDYASDYIRFLRCRVRTLFKYFYSQPRSELESYDNIVQLVLGGISNDTLLEELSLQPSVDVNVNFNKFPTLVRKTASLTDLYYKKDKSKKVNYHVLENTFDNF